MGTSVCIAQFIKNHVCFFHRVLFDRIHYPDSPLLTQHSGTAMPVLNQVTTPSSSTSMLEPQVPPSVGTVSPSRKDSEEKGTPVITEKNVESDTPPNPPLHRYATSV